MQALLGFELCNITVAWCAYGGTARERYTSEDHWKNAFLRGMRHPVHAIIWTCYIFFVAELCNVSSGWVGGSGSFHGLWLKHATYGKVQWNMWWQCHCFSNICRLKHATFQGAAECGGSATASPTFAGSSMQLSKVQRSAVAVPLLLQRCLQAQACSIPRCSGMQWQYRSFPNVRSNFVCSALTPVLPRDNGR